MKNYLIQIQTNFNRDSNEKMLVFVDDRELYEAKPMETISFILNEGFHMIRFRYKIRDKLMPLLVSSSYAIAANYNSLSGLIEVNIRKTPDSEEGVSDADLNYVSLTKPSVVSEEGRRGLDVAIEDDDPIYVFNGTSGLKEGVLRIYEKRLEFATARDLKIETVRYANVVAVKPKMGSIDVQCEGNVHKVYSIPKENYNEVIAFLNNRIAKEQ
ncbi:hypothetical protein [Butyrivibrio sp. FCS014]|uniref:hypothetical protein n=1 Tax=Butyrivibrio sp. FCS014 TaxID=1408304 RepID=UPI000465EF5D|nr:hypothetical protein [Butyrivibrio sp. FCS014]